MNKMNGNSNNLFLIYTTYISSISMINW